MKAKNALTLALAAGLCGTAMAAEIPGDMPGVGKEMKYKSAGLVGHIYYKVATGEMVFTPAAEYLANKAQTRGVRAFGDDVNGDGVADYWVNTNSNPCGDTTTEGASIVAVDSPTTVGDFHHYKSQIPMSDVLVESMQFSFWTDVVDTDTDSDGNPDGNTGGHGMAITFWDKEDVFGPGSSFCTIAGGPGFVRSQVVTYNLTNLPGPLTAPPANYLSGFILTFDLAGGSEMEIADSDGNGPASGFFNAFVAADADSDTFADSDTNGDGLNDLGISLQGIQPSFGGAPLIGYQLAAPGIDPDSANGPAPYQMGWDLVTAAPDADNIPNAGNRLDAGQPLGTSWDMTRVATGSVPSPLATPRFISVADIDANANTANQSYISRFSLFASSDSQSPFANNGLWNSGLGCGGLPSSDFFGWGNTSTIDSTFYGGLNCLIQDNGGHRPWAGVWLALSGPLAAPCTCDIDGSGNLNLDDVNLFAAGFIGGDLSVDQDGNGTLNLDDVNLFAACFIAGCP